MRPHNRQNDEMRVVAIECGYTSSPDGSVLVEFGKTKVICTAMVEQGVPKFLRNKNTGWLTAEYGMLPGATDERTEREAAKGKQSGRTVEIQRIIGRSLRQCVDLDAIPDRQIRVDCDVIQADGGTRTAAITGGCVAVALALYKIHRKQAFQGFVAAMSVGLIEGEARLDLEYQEDSVADTDMNVVMQQDKGFIEVQATAERSPMSPSQFQSLIALADLGIRRLYSIQAGCLQEWYH